MFDSGATQTAKTAYLIGKANYRIMGYSFTETQPSFASLRDYVARGKKVWNSVTKHTWQGSIIMKRIYFLTLKHTLWVVTSANAVANSRPVPTSLTVWGKVSFCASGERCELYREISRRALRGTLWSSSSLLRKSFEFRQYVIRDRPCYQARAKA